MILNCDDGGKGAEGVSWGIDVVVGVGFLNRG